MPTFRQLSLLFAAVLLIPTLARADLPFDEVEINRPISRQPILKCIAHHDVEFNARADRLLEMANHALQCGDLERLLKISRKLQIVTERELEWGSGSQTERGWCYEKKNCKGDLVYQSIVEKGSCDAAEGKSWKRTSPSEGVCQNL